MALEIPDFQAFRGGERPRFANRAELECAKVLDYYGVPWEYEPTTFVLETDEDGRVTEAFTPDFYLPEQDHYLCRTLRLRAPASVAVATLLDRPYRRLVDDLPVQYVGFTVPDELFVGYGFDLDERFRNLPDLHVFRRGVAGEAA